MAGHEVLTDFLQVVVQTSSERVPSVADLLHDRVFRRGLDFKVLRECRRVEIHGANGREVTRGLTETGIYRVNPFTLQRVCRVVEPVVRGSETLWLVVHEQRGGNEEST